MATRQKNDKKDKEVKIIHFCKECKHVTPVYRHNTLSVHGRKPTLGECPFWTTSRSVLLSQLACENFEA